MRAVGAELRRQERESRRRQREAERAWRQAEQERSLAAAEYEVAAYEAYMEALTTVHREASEQLDWHQLRDAKDPPPPEAPAGPGRAASSAAQTALEEHQPGFFEKVFGLKGPQRKLEQAVQDAIAGEDLAYQTALQQHAEQLTAHAVACDDAAALRDVARRLLDGDPKTHAEVIQEFGCFSELASVAGHAGKFSFKVAIEDARGEVTMSVLEDVVPEQVKTLTKSGKVSRKKMPATLRRETYEDYVCGAALRVAREMMAVTPLDAVLVHVQCPMLNTATGHKEEQTILSVYCPRDALSGLRWSRVDASDLVGTLLHNMKVKRGQGFQAVEKLAMPERAEGADR